MDQTHITTSSELRDSTLAGLIQAEADFQENTINLIAASNYLSSGVCRALDPRLNNIHAEGYPGNRYHEGQAIGEKIEELAVERAKKLFDVDHANVQPYRGTVANLAAAIAVLNSGDTLMGLECRSGGHYTTSGSVHVTGRLFKVVNYSVDQTTNQIDYDYVASRARKERPKVLFCGETSYSLLWDYGRLREIANEVGAVLIADLSQTLGLVAGNAIPSPIPYVDIVTAATYKTLRGPRCGLILCKSQYAEAVDRAVSPICQGGPNISLLAGLATALFEASQPSFEKYVEQIIQNSRAFSHFLAQRGLNVVAGRSENHACLLDVRDLDLRGNEVAARLSKAGLICNGNQIPFDPHPPTAPSGLRLGVSAITTLGANETDSIAIAGFVADGIEAVFQDEELYKLGLRVAAFRRKLGRSNNTLKFPDSSPSPEPISHMAKAH